MPWVESAFLLRNLKAPKIKWRCLNVCYYQLKQQVDVIAEQLKNSVSTVIVDYRGLTVAEVTELRSQLREAGVEYKVYKNTMVRRAAEQAGIEGLDEFLTGPTAVATSTEDVVAPAKVIAGFAKEHEALEIKTGVMEGSVISAEEVKTVGSLPSHDGLVSMLFISITSSSTQLRLCG